MKGSMKKILRLESEHWLGLEKKEPDLGNFQ